MTDLRPLAIATLLLSPWAAPAATHAQDDKEWPPAPTTTTPPPDAPPPATDPPPADAPVVTTERRVVPAPDVQGTVEVEQRPAPTRRTPVVFLDGFFHLGFGGTLEGDFDSDGFADTSDELDVGAGLGFRAHFMFGPYFGLGGLVRAAWIPDQRDTFVQRVVDIDLSLHVRFPISVFEPYLTVPLGVTLSAFTFDGLRAGDTTTTGVGFNGGMTVGARFWLARVFNLFVEVGFVGRITSETADDVGVDFTATTFQGTLQTGASLAF